MNKHERKFLDKIAESPGIAAPDLPRAKRGETIKSLELSGLIHFGPGGWYLTAAGEIARCEDVAAETGGIPADEKTVLHGDDEVKAEAVAARGKRAEERTGPEKVEVVHDRANAADRIETIVRRELATFADEYDRKLVIDALERRLVEIRSEVAY